MKFFFDIDNRAQVGSFEAETLAEAKCEAMRIAGQLICDQAESTFQGDDASWGMTVSNDTGLTLLRIDIIATEAPAGRTGPISVPGAAAQE